LEEEATHSACYTVVALIAVGETFAGGAERVGFQEFLHENYKKSGGSKL